MTTQTEFAKALEAFDNCRVVDAMDLAIMHGDTIRRALRIADKLMQEPSKEMHEAGHYANVPPYNIAYIHIYRAMLNQLLKEVEK